ncbi:hypothetical protein COEREDRAFT_80022 [Coemansia reversa NRRL 1564]|uniref:Uncharacterized protein n=1 Tax=Coemansia reversa (strain ATCC 12441 / NRRL 1564) TaxID=763665 RepID=A0A2G5BGE3_COERN|nr:hypothetical protein COEREDRAFT_80022 [Coemansia reversa NRRL 1564]|eukprot:PIA18071.1 hypothetical protein COEREDRAFT_80022 [Coemansia reversa NRRL 1564]
MYDSNTNDDHAYSTPASPNPYCSQSPADGKTAYDRELASLFRSTAANVTQLYKEASSIGSSAYKAGYEQCYDDLWEFMLTAQTDTASLTDSDDHRRRRQMMIQQLLEFARAKRLAPRQPHSNTAGGSFPSPPASQSHDYQQRLTADLACSSGRASSIDAPQVPLPQPVVQSREDSTDRVSGQRFTKGDDDHQQNREQGAAVESIRGNSAFSEGLIRTTNGCLLREAVSGGAQPLLQNKRILDTFDSMDIEPPRRRQRRDNIEAI